MREYIIVEKLKKQEETFFSFIDVAPPVEWPVLLLFT